MLHDYQEKVSFYVLESVLIYKMSPSFNNYEALVPLNILRSSFFKTVNIYLSCFFFIMFNYSMQGIDCTMTMGEVIPESSVQLK